MKFQRATIRLSGMMLACMAAGALAANNPGKNPTASPPGGSASGVQALTVASTFKPGAVIPRRFTGDGADVSPPLNWSEAPSSAGSIAVICYDPDAPRGRWYHWLLWNLPANTRSLHENVPKQSTVFDVAAQGTNDFGKIGYNGPAPPKGNTHHYHFNVLALDTALAVKSGARKEEVLDAVRGHIVAEGDLVGIYWR